MGVCAKKNRKRDALRFEQALRERLWEAVRERRE
jgi:hypothetical protein